MPLDGAERWVNALSWMTDGGMFAESNDGAYADPVAEGVATLPFGWRDRLIRFETQNMIAPNGLQARAWVPEPHDLLASKYIAGRPNDFEFCEAVIATGVIEQETLVERLETIRREHPHKALSADVALSAVRKTFGRTFEFTGLPVYEPASHEIVDRREDFTLDMEQSMRVLGRSEDGKRIFGRCGGGILSAASEGFTQPPALDDIVTLSRENGRDVALPQKRDRGLKR